MFIQKITKKTADKIYTSYLLIENYREGDKVKHRTLCNLTHWPINLINQFDDLLKGKALTSIEDLKYVQGKSCGGLIVVKDIAKRLGIINALGSNKEGQLALLQIMGRIFTQGSRLHLAESWSKNHAISEVLDIKKFDEDDLYDNLDWLANNQSEIEKKIFHHRCKNAITEISFNQLRRSFVVRQLTDSSGRQLQPFIQQPATSELLLYDRRPGPVSHSINTGEFVANSLQYLGWLRLPRGSRSKRMTPTVARFVLTLVLHTPMHDWRKPWEPRENSKIRGTKPECC